MKISVTKSLDINLTEQEALDILVSKLISLQLLPKDVDTSNASILANNDNNRSITIAFPPIRTVRKDI